MHDNVFALIDFETTGLTFHPESNLDNQPRSIEFGGILTDGEIILEECSLMIDPEVQIEEIITKITGITQEQLTGQPTFRQRVPEISKFLSKADVAIAHNMQFDKSIMTHDLRRLGLGLADVNWPEFEFCTVELTKPFFGRRMKLEELYNLHIGEMVQTHRAVDDCKLLFEVCKHLEIFKCL